MDSGYVIWALKLLFFDIVYGISFSPIIDIVFLLSEKENFLAVGLWGALLSASRNIGVMFVFAVLVYCLCFFSAERTAFYAICGFTTCRTKAVSWNLYDSVGAF